MNDDPVRIEEERAAHLLKTLAPGPLDQPDPRRAYRQFKQSVESKGEEPMQNFRSDRKLQRILAPVMAVLLIAGLLAVPQVRALASSFLSLFRVEKFVLVSVDPDRVDQIRQAIGDEAQFGDKEVLVAAGDPVSVASLDEAQAQAGFRPLVADSAYGTIGEVYVRGLESMRFTPHTAEIRALYEQLGLDPNLIPENIDGKPFDITVGASVMTNYDKTDNHRSYGLVQAPAPVVSAPDGVDVRKLGVAMLQLLGMSPEEAERISKTIDWTTTLVVPVPANTSTIQEVTVRGTTGLLFDGESDGPYDGNGTATPPRAVLMWQENGYIFVVTAESPTAATLFAESLK